MKDGPDIVGIAALIGDHTRADILTALLADRALTATELAALAGVTKQTMSAHLARLKGAGLITVECQGRHRYFRLAGQDVAYLLESLMGVAFRTGAVRLRSSPREPALRHARVCYDHLAGSVAVEVYERLRRGGALTAEEPPALTAAGKALFRAIGIEPDAAGSRRALCRPCLDWSERRPHLAGGLGAALYRRILELGWAVRVKDARTVRFTAGGEAGLRAWLEGLGG